MRSLARFAPMRSARAACGVSKRNVLGDQDICGTMPEVFAPPPESVSGYMAKEAEKALIEWNPLIESVIRHRGLFGAAPHVMREVMQNCPVPPPGLRSSAVRFLRRNLFDHFGRRQHGGRSDCRARRAPCYVVGLRGGRWPTGFIVATGG